MIVHTRACVCVCVGGGGVEVTTSTFLLLISMQVGPESKKEQISVLLAWVGALEGGQEGW